MKKAEKTFFVDNLTEEIKSAKSVVLVNYTGMSVSMQQDLKKRLAEVGSSMVVVKNTLLKLAGEKAGIDAKVLDESILSGQTALVISESDPVGLIQVLGKFAKEFELPKMKVGVVEGSFQDAESLLKLSTLPGKDVLLGQVLGALMAPSYSLVGVLNAGPQMLISILDRKAKG
jgi:large subunit ribosomal protein L10